MVRLPQWHWHQGQATPPPVCTEWKHFCGTTEPLAVKSFVPMHWVHGFGPQAVAGRTRPQHHAEPVTQARQARRGGLGLTQRRAAGAEPSA